MKKIIFFCIFWVFIFFSNSQSNLKLQNFKGTWITNVGSKALLSKQDIDTTIDICKKNNINHIFVVVWNNGVTMYPSKLIKKFIGIEQSKDYTNFDPIDYIIFKAHQNNIYVHAWFEFGFSYSYKDSNSIWKQKYPHWIGVNKMNMPLQKNDFYWWNPYLPEVKDFMFKLITEVLEKYNFDGIQGDDRLPANPIEGGYDSFTKKLYHVEFNKYPPQNEHDAHWVQWRADKLSLYAKEIFNLAKKINPNILVSWSPSIYPWSKENYLQDWLPWIENGYADFIIPQLYRYNLNSYEQLLKQLKLQINPTQQYKVFPGVLTALGDGYLINQNMFNEIIKLNRNYSFNGECLFYFECLKYIKY